MIYIYCTMSIRSEYTRFLVVDYLLQTNTNGINNTKLSYYSSGSPDLDWVSQAHYAVQWEQAAILVGVQDSDLLQVSGITAPIQNIARDLLPSDKQYDSAYWVNIRSTYTGGSTMIQAWMYYAVFHPNEWAQAVEIHGTVLSTVPGQNDATKQLLIANNVYTESGLTDAINNYTGYSTDVTAEFLFREHLTDWIDTGESIISNIPPAIPGQLEIARNIIININADYYRLIDRWDDRKLYMDNKSIFSESLSPLNLTEEQYYTIYYPTQWAEAKTSLIATAETIYTAASLPGQNDATKELLIANGNVTENALDQLINTFNTDNPYTDITEFYYNTYLAEWLAAGASIISNISPVIPGQLELARTKVPTDDWTLNNWRSALPGALSPLNLTEEQYYVIYRPTEWLEAYDDITAAAAVAVAATLPGQNAKTQLYILSEIGGISNADLTTAINTYNYIDYVNKPLTEFYYNTYLTQWQTAGASIVAATDSTAIPRQLETARGLNTDDTYSFWSSLSGDFSGWALTEEQYYAIILPDIWQAANESTAAATAAAAAAVAIAGQRELVRELVLAKPDVTDIDLDNAINNYIYSDSTSSITEFYYNTYLAEWQTAGQQIIDTLNSNNILPGLPGQLDKAHDIIVLELIESGIDYGNALASISNNINYWANSVLALTEEQYYILIHPSQWAEAGEYVTNNPPPPPFESNQSLPHDTNFLIDTSFNQLNTINTTSVDGIYTEHYGYHLHRYAPYETGIMNIGCTITPINSDTAAIEFNCSAYKKKTNQNRDQPGFNVMKMMSAVTYDVFNQSDSSAVSIQSGEEFNINDYKNTAVSNSPIDGITENVLTESYSNNNTKISMETIKQIFTDNSINSSRDIIETRVTEHIDTLLGDLNGTKIWAHLETDDTNNRIIKFYKAVECLDSDKLSLSHSDYLGDGPDTNLSNGTDAQLFAEWFCHHQNNLDKISSLSTQGIGALVDKTFMEHVVGSIDSFSTSPTIVTINDMGTSDAAPNDSGLFSIRVKTNIENHTGSIWHTTGTSTVPTNPNTRTEFGVYLQITKQVDATSIVDLTHVTSTLTFSI
mgnify:CR=1 FL=1